VIAQRNSVRWAICPFSSGDANKRLVCGTRRNGVAINALVVDKMKDNIPRLYVTHQSVDIAIAFCSLWGPKRPTKRMVARLAIWPMPNESLLDPQAAVFLRLFPHPS
jgi:hypothetical protein